MIDRLKSYIEYRGFLASQFADAVGMPRSSFSQLMSGRNKSINDATIVKIHAAFPDLSIQWLLFGEGDMLTNGIELAPISSVCNEPSSQELQQPQLSIFGESEIFEAVQVDERPYAQENAPKKPANDVPAVPKMPVEVPMAALKQRDRKIVKVVVFYDDNTYEAFVPQ